MVKQTRVFDSSIVLYEHMKQLVTNKPLLNGVLPNSYLRTLNVFTFL